MEELLNSERVSLSDLVSHPGFSVLQKIMLSECEKFKVALLNVRPGDAQELLQRHAVAQSAAQFYTAIVSRMNSEIDQLRHDKEMDGLSDEEKKAMDDVLSLDV